MKKPMDAIDLIAINIFFLFYMLVVGCSGPIVVPDLGPATAQSIECTTGKQKEKIEFDQDNRHWVVRFDYCFENHASSTVMYYMHGAGSNEQAWFKAAMFDKAFPKFQEAAKLMGDKHPKVITVSWGGTWILNDQGYQRRKGDNSETTKIFAERIMPYLEAKYQLGPNPKRVLLGISMGGANAYQLFVQYPQLWNRLALVNAMFPLCDQPCDLLKSLSCYATKDLKIIGSLLLACGGYDNEAHYDANSPFFGGASRLNASLPPSLHQWALADEFRFTESDKKVFNAFVSKGAKAKGISSPGDHGDLNPVELAKFLTE